MNTVVVGCVDSDASEGQLVVRITLVRSWFGQYATEGARAEDVPLDIRNELIAWLARGEVS